MHPKIRFEIPELLIKLFTSKSNFTKEEFVVASEGFINFFLPLEETVFKSIQRFSEKLLERIQYMKKTFGSFYK